MVYKKELEKTVKKLRTQVLQLEKMLEDEKQVSQLRLDSLLNQRDESDKLQDKIFELQQQIDAQETKGPVFQVCDPSMQYAHKFRNMGVDVYVERHSSDEKLLLTRIPITFDYDVFQSMSFEERAAILNPLVCGLKEVYNRSDEPIVHIQASINDMHWTEE